MDLFLSIPPSKHSLSLCICQVLDCAEKQKWGYQVWQTIEVTHIRSIGREGEKIKSKLWKSVLLSYRFMGVVKQLTVLAKNARRGTIPAVKHLLFVGRTSRGVWLWPGSKEVPERWGICIYVNTLILFILYFSWCLTYGHLSASY